MVTSVWKGSKAHTVMGVCWGRFMGISIQGPPDPQGVRGREHGSLRSDELINAASEGALGSSVDSQCVWGLFPCPGM